MVVEEEEEEKRVRCWTGEDPVSRTRYLDVLMVGEGVVT